MTFHAGQHIPHYRAPKPYWDRDWLLAEYVGKERSAVEIAAQFGITIGAVYQWLRRHEIPRRTVSQSRMATINRRRDQG